MLACWVFSRQGLDLAQTLRENLANHPFALQDKWIDSITIFAPTRIANNLGNNLANRLANNLGKDLENDLGSNLVNSLPSNLDNNLGNDLANDLANNFENDLSGNLANSFGKDLVNNLKNDLANDLENDLDSNLANSLGKDLISNLDNNLVTPIQDLAQDFQANYPTFFGHIFIGATGIAVRLLAKVITDKLHDRPAVVLDPQGRFAISLLAGHWGGGNALANHIAKIIHATPVITTASDLFNPEVLPLDLTIQKCDLFILDRHLLPKIQGLILEGAKIALYDPDKILPDRPYLQRVASLEEAKSKPPYITVGWQNFKPEAEHLRLIAQNLTLGVGLHRGLDAGYVQEAIELFLDQEGIAVQAIKCLGSIERLAKEEALKSLAAKLNIACHYFTAQELAKVSVPNPSSYAGKAFHEQPFSVAEGAALLACKQYFQEVRLLRPKIKIDRRMTLAIACGLGKK